MNNHFTYKEVSPDGLEQETWRFWLNDRLCLVLNYYERAERPTKRHGFKVLGKWDRLASFRRGNTLPEKPAVPDEVRAAIMADAVSKLHFE